MAANNRSIEYFDRLVEMHSTANIPPREERLIIEAPNRPGPKSWQREQKRRRRNLEESTGSLVRIARNGMLCPVVQRDRELGYNFLKDCGIEASDWNCGRTGKKSRYGGLPPATFVGGLPDLAHSRRAVDNRREMALAWRVERLNGKDQDGFNQEDKPLPSKVEAEAEVSAEVSASASRPIRKYAIRPSFF